MSVETYRIKGAAVVQAVQRQGDNKGDLEAILAPEPVTFIETGEWVVKDKDGTITIMDDAAFVSMYELLPGRD